MRKIRIGINGLGRIGRVLIRELIKQKSIDASFPLEIAAVNNPGHQETYLHLLQYDSVHGVFPYPIHRDQKTIKIENDQFHFYSEMDPTQIPWGDDKVDIVIDATGVFKDKEGLSKHLHGTVKKVIMCAPGKNLDGTFVMGINHENFKANEHHVISNASCTTNCLAPVAKVINDHFGIDSGFMTTVHAYTNDQSVLDQSHSDLRRARAASLSMIPTTTGAAKALGEVIPELAGKLDGYAVRVPTPNVSMVDLTVNTQKEISKDSINQAIKNASENELRGILGYSHLPLVSVDFVGCPFSSIFDAGLTNVIGRTAKIVAWYDNEVGFSRRVLDLASYVGEKTWS